MSLAFAAPLFASSLARAQTACGDTTCPKGFTCETMSLGCPAIDCAEGAECPPCEPGEVQVCVAANCATDADCGSDMVCATYVSEECSGGTTPACRPDAECGPAIETPPPTCTTSESRVCTPRWQMPCEADADCGAGFNCVELMRGSCGGSDPVPPSSGSGASGAEPAPSSGSGASGAEPAARAPLPPDCTTEPSGVKACQAVQTACTTDADCVSGWSCDENPEGVCWSDVNGNSGCEPADPARICRPPYSNLPVWGSDGRVSTADGAPAVPGSGPASGESDASGNGSSSEGGCSISAAPNERGAGLAFVALSLGAALGLRRRRSARS